ncbi:hypothetical protein H310_13925 [Aphanomyces invadans]|uniref:Uncharacterized protein n=1 Tax=Aphanomyces invadans TaxID=157072 RepID=A0A024TBX7_9STRA|nr:hypothetical protein H310_13925 [Aphanomyces invadans]ETV91543.1 hypothetical protein H310_13925 [Aphanomyces invadans]|eukprot:XP_008879811.1 hypothetical protein H310_13925 [Aphanomyces invadans]
MKRLEGQAELKQIAARGKFEGALQTLGSLEAVEQLLSERRDEEAAQKAEELEEPATVVPREHFWTSEDLDFARVRTDEVPFVDGEAFGIVGVGEATFEYVCNAASDVNVDDEADDAGIPLRVFEANAYLAEFGRTHYDFERHILWMLSAVVTMTMVAADGRGFARFKDRMREGDPSGVLDVGHVDLCESETLQEYITVFVYSLLRQNVRR